MLLKSIACVITRSEPILAEWDFVQLYFSFDVILKKVFAFSCQCSCFAFERFGDCRNCSEQASNCLLAKQVLNSVFF